MVVDGAVWGTLPNDCRTPCESYYPFQITNTDLVPFVEPWKLAEVLSGKSWIPWNPHGAGSNLTSQPKWAYFYDPETVLQTEFGEQLL